MAPHHREHGVARSAHCISYVRLRKDARLVATSVKYYTKFLTSDTHTVLLKLHAKLAPGWVLIRVNFDPVQEIGRKVGGGRSFVSGPFFARLRYRKRGEGILANVLIYLLGPVKT